MAIPFNGLIDNIFDESYTSLIKPESCGFVPDDIEISRKISLPGYDEIQEYIEFGDVLDHPVYYGEHYDEPSVGILLFHSGFTCDLYPDNLIGSLVDRPIYHGKFYNDRDTGNLLQYSGVFYDPLSDELVGDLHLSEIRDLDFFVVSCLRSEFYIDFNSDELKSHEHIPKGYKLSIGTDRSNDGLIGHRVYQSKRGLTYDNYIGHTLRLRKGIIKTNYKPMGYKVKSGYHNEDILFGIRRPVIHIGLFDDPFDEWNPSPTLYNGVIYEKYVIVPYPDHNILVVGVLPTEYYISGDPNLTDGYLIGNCNNVRKGMIPNHLIDIETIELVSCRILPIDYWRQELPFTDTQVGIAHKGFIDGNEISIEGEYPRQRNEPASYTYNY